MVSEILLAGTASPQDFAALIQAYQPVPESVSPTLMLLESLPSRIVEPRDRQKLLIFEVFRAGFDFSLYTTGRIFHTHGELRWEKYDRDIRIVYTDEIQYSPETSQMQNVEREDLGKYKKESGKYFLFGKRLDDIQLERIGAAAQKGDFAEIRIPRLLRYPVLRETANAERVQLETYEYKDTTTGKTVAYRFHKLVSFQEKASKSAGVQNI